MKRRPSPRERGYRMPAEWEPQAAIWLAWPHNPETWPGPSLERVRHAWGEVILALGQDQAVCLLVNDLDSEAAAREVLQAQGVSLSGVSFIHIPTCDTWIRDYGPTFLVNDTSKRVALVVWNFNAWGGKYPDLLADDRIPAGLAEYLGVPAFDAGFVLEGGSIEVNGCGLLMTTEQCLLHPNRNPGMSREDLERCLQDYLGVSEIIWLGDGIAGDDTDGHIDDIARFVAPDTVVCALEQDPADANYRLLRDNYERLTRFRDRSGAPLRVVSLPMPAPVVDGDVRFPASYANFYIGNRSVLVPLFGGASDADALRTLARCFPHRRVIGIDCRVMVQGLGTIHCCSQQQPLV